MTREQDDRARMRLLSKVKDASGSGKGKLWREAFEVLGPTFGTKDKMVSASADLGSGARWINSSRPNAGPSMLGRGTGQEELDRPQFGNGTRRPSTTSSTDAAGPTASGSGLRKDQTSPPSDESTRHKSALSPSRPQLPGDWTRKTKRAVGPGLYNQGNTCFLNSTLQALIHTPPLALGFLDRREHDPKLCNYRAKTFCALCAMDSLSSRLDKPDISAVSPNYILTNLRRFAPTMRVGTQEDAHEFLRFLVDAMQRACLADRGDKAKKAEKESTFVYRLFGGRLRSRVTCDRCKNHSDAFDAFLDLSLDVFQASTVQQALKGLVKSDRLFGQNKYKCEKCKGLRDAQKVFTVDLGPPILTVHLKRFMSNGKKIGRSIDFGEDLDLGQAMAGKRQDARYKLFAVVEHIGGSNSSGHYVCHAKGSDGRWYLFNDSVVSSANSSSVLGNRNAYILFYAKQRPEGVAAAIAGYGTQSLPPSPTREPLGKRKDRDTDDDRADHSNRPRHEFTNGQMDTASRPFIGPMRPAGSTPAAPHHHHGGAAVPLVTDGGARRLSSVSASSPPRKPAADFTNKVSFSDDFGFATNGSLPKKKRPNMIKGMQSRPRILTD